MAKRLGPGGAQRVAQRPVVIVLDTTVLIYAVGADRRLRESARRLVQAIGNGTLAATTTVEVMGADNLDGLVSADRAFAAVPQLRHVDLADDDAIAALLTT